MGSEELSQLAFAIVEKQMSIEDVADQLTAQELAELKSEIKIQRSMTEAIRLYSFRKIALELRFQKSAYVLQKRQWLRVQGMRLDAMTHDGFHLESNYAAGELNAADYILSKISSGEGFEWSVANDKGITAAEAVNYSRQVLQIIFNTAELGFKAAQFDEAIDETIRKMGKQRVIFILSFIGDAFTAISEALQPF